MPDRAAHHDISDHNCGVRFPLGGDYSAFYIDFMIDIEPFVRHGRDELSPYVVDVERFLDDHRDDQNREDAGLRNKPPETYIRNMLLIGILNRLNRQAFKATSYRIIVLPDCLKNYSDWDCAKETVGGVGECTQCHPECQVFEAVERFADAGTEVVLEPDDLDKYFARQREEYGTVGVIGVACVLTLLSGFQVTLKHRLPTQGIFLNYSSCSYHWADPGYNTSFSFRRLAEIMSRGSAEEPSDERDRGETYSLEKAPLSPDVFYRRLDGLAEQFEREYLPRFQDANPGAGSFELMQIVMGSLVPDVISRDSA